MLNFASLKHNHTAHARYFIGIMSGTSLDGVDAVLVKQQDSGMQQVGAYFLPYPQTIKTALLALHQPAHNELHVAAVISNQLASLYAQAVQGLLQKCTLPAAAVTAIGCHGQTVRHCPDLTENAAYEGATYEGSAYTLQLGNHARLAELTGITVVGDFRSRDIAAGGQGAPLVPAFHQAVFASTEVHRVIVNIGGIANLSDLPPSGQVTGFDSGPGNLLMDAWTFQHTGQPYDADGAWAAQGQVHAGLLDAMLTEAFLDLQPPKSTGRDLFNSGWLNAHLQNHQESPVNVACTLLEYTAKTIADALHKYCTGAQEVYVCGGGAHNRLLMKRLQAYCGLPLYTTAALGVEADWVEAVAFAWLAQRCIDGQTGNLPAVTGALGARILGAIYPA